MTTDKEKEKLDKLVESTAKILSPKETEKKEKKVERK
jgi:hypothetical protein